MKSNKEKKAEIEERPLIFVRHGSMDSTHRVYRELIDDNLIALHYVRDLKREERRRKRSGRVVVPEHFKKDTPGRKVMERLTEYCTDGAIVAADYSQYSSVIPATMIVGIISPGSKPKTKRIKPCKPSEGEVIKKYYPNGTMYSIVKLKDAVKFDYAEYGILRTSQARKQGNVIRWSVGGIDRWIKSIYMYKLHLIKKISPDVHLLTADQLEVLCSEYLRSVLAPSDLRMEYFLTPVGRGTRDTDIDGESKNRHILGQVSFSENEDKIMEKIEDLQSYEEEYDGQKELVLVYFGPKERKPKNELGNVWYIPIENVFKKIQTHKRGILESMLPFCKF